MINAKGAEVQNVGLQVDADCSVFDDDCSVSGQFFGGPQRLDNVMFHLLFGNGELMLLFSCRFVVLDREVDHLEALAKALLHTVHLAAPKEQVLVKWVVLSTFQVHNFPLVGRIFIEQPPLLTLPMFALQYRDVLANEDAAWVWCAADPVAGNEPCRVLVQIFGHLGQDRKSGNEQPVQSM